MHTFIALSLAVSALALAPPSGTVLSLKRRAQPAQPVPLTSAKYGSNFDVEVQLGNQSVLLLLDTGSSDTWVIEKGFQCLDPATDLEIPAANCDYGKPYVTSETFEEIHNETFAVSYGAGKASGRLGYENVTLGGIHVPRQKVGVATRATNVGDGVNSGIMGFGHDILTSAHAANFDVSNFNQSFLADRITYEGLFTSMWKQGKVEPYFSIAIERTPLNTSTDRHGGYLALGTLPPVKHTGQFTNVSVEVTEALLPLTGGIPVITEWTLNVQESKYGKEVNSTSFQAIVDSGNNCNLYPPELAAEINAAFDPPAKLSTKGGLGQSLYTVSCDAKPPVHGLKIGNHTFYHDPQDLIQQTGDGCISSIAAAYPVEGGISLFFLGDPFLKNVVAVFDFGLEEMKFAARA